MTIPRGIAMNEKRVKVIRALCIAAAELESCEDELRRRRIEKIRERLIQELQSADSVERILSELQAEALDVLGGIEIQIRTAAAVDSPNWGHVGAMAQMAEQLSELFRAE